ncbi:unnamed protein product [Calypogeia fissa]
MRSVTMDDIAQSVAHLTDHILSTLSPKKSGQDHPTVECSTSGGAENSSSSSDVYEGTLGFTNHTKFLQNLCGGSTSWKLGKYSSPSWLLPRIRRPAPASKEEEFSKVKIERNSTDAQDGENMEVVGTKFESLSSEQNRIQFAGSPSIESSTTYGNPSESLLESLVHNEVSSGSAVSKEDLGRATWTFLHTLAAQFPEHPTKQQQRDAKDLMGILSRIYPCKECADHFKDVLYAHSFSVLKVSSTAIHFSTTTMHKLVTQGAHPVESNSGEQLAQWMCRVHNVVNRSLGKAQFPCHRVDFRWGALDCNEGACDLHGRLYK